MDRIFGLPAHPLLVHFPVVAIPVLCLAALAMAVSTKARRLLGLPVLALGAATLVSTFLATNSGDELTEDLVDLFVLDNDQISKHKQLGETTLWLVLLLFVFLCVQFAVGRAVDKKTRESFELPTLAKPGLMVIGAVVAILSVLATVWVVRTGHEGAKVVWKFVDDASNEDASDSASVVTTGPADETANVVSGEASPTEAPTPEPPEPTAEPIPEPTTGPTAEPTVDAAASVETPDPESESESESDDTGTESAAETHTETSDEAPVPVESDGGTGAAATVDALAIYEEACAICHGSDGAGTQRGRPLTAIAAEASLDHHVAAVADGKGNMPAFAARLSPEEIEAVVVFARESF